MLDRNARTPAITKHYRPAPPVVWFQTLVLLGIACVAGFGWIVIT